MGAGFVRCTMVCLLGLASIDGKVLRAGCCDRQPRRCRSERHRCGRISDPEIIAVKLPAITSIPIFWIVLVLRMAEQSPNDGEAR